MKTIAFFNNKGGVGKTTIVYHLAWMYAELGLNVVAADLDPQANLTSMFLDDDRLEELWSDEDRRTIYGALQPLIDGTGDVASPYVEEVSPELSLVVGDLQLSAVEDDLSSQWPGCMDGRLRAFRVISAFWRILREAAGRTGTQLVLIDVGPNLGALNRAALVAADFLVVPLAPDLYSLQGLRNLGPTLHRWRKEWGDRKKRVPDAVKEIPGGTMQPIGYIVMQHAVRLDRPVKAYARWMERIPEVYHKSVLRSTKVDESLIIENDSECIATLKHFRSLMPLAQEARKPMFKLKPADGAIGGHTRAVQECYRCFRNLAEKVVDRCKMDIP